MLDKAVVSQGFNSYILINLLLHSSLDNNSQLLLYRMKLEHKIQNTLHSDNYNCVKDDITTANFECQF